MRRDTGRARRGAELERLRRDHAPDARRAPAPRRAPGAPLARAIGMTTRDRPGHVDALQSGQQLQAGSVRSVTSTRASAENGSSSTSHCDTPRTVVPAAKYQSALAVVAHGTEVERRARLDAGRHHDVGRERLDDDRAGRERLRASAPAPDAARCSTRRRATPGEGAHRVVRHGHASARSACRCRCRVARSPRRRHRPDPRFDSVTRLVAGRERRREARGSTTRSRARPRSGAAPRRSARRSAPGASCASAPGDDADRRARRSRRRGSARGRGPRTGVSAAVMPTPSRRRGPAHAGAPPDHERQRATRRSRASMSKPGQPPGRGSAAPIDACAGSANALVQSNASSASGRARPRSRASRPIGGLGPQQRARPGRRRSAAAGPLTPRRDADGVAARPRPRGRHRRRARRGHGAGVSSGTTARRGIHASFEYTIAPSSMRDTERSSWRVERVGEHRIGGHDRRRGPGPAG